VHQRQGEVARHLGLPALSDVLRGAGGADHFPLLVALHDGVEIQPHGRAVLALVHGLVVELRRAGFDAGEGLQVFFCLSRRLEIRERTSQHLGWFITVDPAHGGIHKRPSPLGVHRPNQVVGGLNQIAIFLLLDPTCCCM
jgi:hypothetical protein